jgi:hypothetical protein
LSPTLAPHSQYRYPTSPPTPHPTTPRGEVATSETESYSDQDDPQFLNDNDNPWLIAAGGFVGIIIGGIVYRYRRTKQGSYIARNNPLFGGGLPNVPVMGGSGATTSESGRERRTLSEIRGDLARSRGEVAF